MRKDDQGRADGRDDGADPARSAPKRGDTAHIDPTRLADASDAILIALEEYKIDTRGGTIAPVELLGLPNQPKILCDYTRWEIEQAAAFMTRLGLLEPVKARKA